MPAILLTQADPALAKAVLEAMPLVNVYERADWPVLGTASAWCFIDWLLDDTSGLELCRRIRAETYSNSVHITVVIDASDQTSRARAMAAGADDYILGPLTPELLVERLRSYMRANGPSAKSSSSAGLAVDPAAHQVRWQGRLVPMRPQEFRLLQMFLNQPNRLLTRAKIIELLGKSDESVDHRTVDVWVGRLRRRLESAGVTGLPRTVRSMGYVFDTPES